MAVIISDNPIVQRPADKINYPSIQNMMGRLGLNTTFRALQSDNFVSGVSGWQLTAEGNIAAVGGTVGGFTVSADGMRSPNAATPYLAILDDGRIILGLETGSHILLDGSGGASQIKFYNPLGNPAISLDVSHYTSPTVGDLLHIKNADDNSYLDFQLNDASAIAKVYQMFYTTGGDICYLYLKDDDATFHIEGADVVIESDLLPGDDDGEDLGSSLKQWKDLYLAGSIIGPVIAVDVSVTYGETITAGNAVVLGTGEKSVYSKVIDNTSYAGDGSTDNVVGNDANHTRVSQSFLVSDTALVVAKYVTIALKKFGAPTDNIELSLQAIVGDVPSGTKLATATKAGTALTTSFATYEFTLSSIVPLADASYAVVMERTGALDDVNYYKVGFLTSNIYANGDNGLYNGSTWTISASRDFGILWVAGLLTTGYAYRTKATDSARTLGFLGIAIESGVLNDVKKVRTKGVYTTSGLTIGPIYLTDTLGAYGSTAGTFHYQIGEALSATTLFLDKKDSFPTAYVGSGSGDDTTPIDIPVGAKCAVVVLNVANTAKTTVIGDAVISKTGKTAGTIQVEVNGFATSGTASWGTSTISISKGGVAAGVTATAYFYG